MPEISGLDFDDVECNAPEVEELLKANDILGAAFKLMDIVEDNTELRQHVWRSLYVQQTTDGVTRDWVEKTLKEVCEVRRRSSFADDLLHYSSSSYNWN